MSDTPVAELVSAGHSVLRYVPLAGDPPTADLAQPLADPDVVVPVVLRDLAGWRFVTDDDDLTTALIEAGCSVARQGHLLSRDLCADPPVPAWASPDVGSLRITPLGCTAEDLVEVSLAAYPAGHPDAETDDPVRVEQDIDQLLTGAAVGPLLDVGAAVWDGPTVVAMTIINRMPGQAPMGGPWVSEVCRDPNPRYAGLGTTLLKLALIRLTQAHESSLSLVVTDGNAALRTYERLGFAYINSFRKLQIPA